MQLLTKTVSIQQVIAAIVLPLLLCIAIIIWYQLEIDYQDDRNDYLADSVDEMDEKISSLRQLNQLKSDLLERQHIISLVGSAVNYGPVHVLGDVSRNAPQGLSIDSIHLRGGDLRLTGKAADNVKIGLFRDAMISQSYLSMKSKGDLEIRSDQGALNFVLDLQLSKNKVSQE